MKHKIIKNVFALSLVTLMLAGNSVMAATSTVWKEAPAKFYDASKIYGNGWRDGYSFYINKLAKKGKKTDQKSYQYLNVWLVGTNPKIRLRYDKTGQEKNQWFFVAKKQKKYSYLFVDKNGTVGALKTGLNVEIKGYNNKNMNTNITHTMD